jgi:hypothetical protein
VHAAQPSISACWRHNELAVLPVRHSAPEAGSWPKLWALSLRAVLEAIVSAPTEVTSNAHIIETGTQSYRLPTTKARSRSKPG